MKIVSLCVAAVAALFCCASIAAAATADPAQALFLAWSPDNVMIAMGAMVPMSVSDRVRGLVAARADGDPKQVIEQLNKAFEEFKSEHQKEVADLKKGMADVVQSEKVDRINTEVGKLQKAMDELNSSVAALTVGGAGGDNKPLSAEKREHTKAFNQFFRKGVENNLRDLEAKAALRTDSDPDGGYVVPEEMEQTIDRVLGTVSAMRSISRVISISASTYKKLVNQGGADAGWVGEKQARPETGTPSLVELAYTAMELYANPAATQTLLDDARVDIAQWLADEVSIAFAEKEAGAFISGDGVNKPRGLLSYGTVANASYQWGKLGYIVSGVAAALTDSTHNGVDALIDLVYALKTGYRQNANFLMNRKTAAAVRKLKDKDDQYLWQPSVQAGQPSTLLGYPVVDDDDMPDATSGGNLPIAFGDFKRGYLIVDRTGIRVLRDPFTNKPYVHFYTTKRVGGGVQNFEAIKLLKIGTS